jgi:hypothetical protein
MIRRIDSGQRTGKMLIDVAGEWTSAERVFLFCFVCEHSAPAEERSDIPRS